MSFYLYGYNPLTGKAAEPSDSWRCHRVREDPEGIDVRPIRWEMTGEEGSRVWEAFPEPDHGFRITETMEKGSPVLRLATGVGGPVEVNYPFADLDAAFASAHKHWRRRLLGKFMSLKPTTDENRNPLKDKGAPVSSGGHGDYDPGDYVIEHTVTVRDQSGAIVSMEGRPNFTTAEKLFQGRKNAAPAGYRVSLAHGDRSIFNVVTSAAG